MGLRINLGILVRARDWLQRCVLQQRLVVVSRTHAIAPISPRAHSCIACAEPRRGKGVRRQAATAEAWARLAHGLHTTPPPPPPPSVSGGGRGPIPASLERRDSWAGPVFVCAPPLSLARPIRASAGPSRYGRCSTVFGAEPDPCRRETSGSVSGPSRAGGLTVRLLGATSVRRSVTPRTRRRRLVRRRATSAARLGFSRRRWKNSRLPIEPHTRAGPAWKKRYLGF